MQNVNTQFNTSYTADTFIGTNFYKFFYALAQRMQENEVKTAEIFAKLQGYFKVTNEALARPNTTNPGLIDYFKANGFSVSLKPMIEADAGKISVAVDLDNAAPGYAAQKLAFATLLSKSAVGGTVTLGTETQAVTFSNLQSFDFKFSLADKIPIKLRLTLTLSENNEFLILTPEETAEILFANINARYRFGLNFEPQRYFSIIDAPWAAGVLLEYSLDNGATWSKDIVELDFDELYTFDLDDISVVEA